nr:hypothetical protein [Tanacetum cinerariifolium]
MGNMVIVDGLNGYWALDVGTVNSPVITTSLSISTAEPSTPPTTTTLIENEDLIIAQTLMKMRSVKSKEKSKEKGVSSIRLTRGVIMNKANYRLAARSQEEDRGELTIKEKSRLFMELWIKERNILQDLELKRSKIESFVSMDSEVVERSSQVERSKQRIRKELDEASVKRQKLEDDTEKAELKLYIEIVPKDDEAINVESLATKYPIVNWKIHILDENNMYYQIIRVDGSTKYYKIFSAMLDDFDRQGMLDLYRLVKERFETTNLEGYDRLLWGDLITLFQPSKEDEI